VNFTGSAGFTRGGFEAPGTNTKLNVLSPPCTGPIGTTCSTPTQFSSFVSKQLDLKVTQPVYRGGRTEAATRQAINTVEATRAQTLGVETTIFQAVAQAYLDVVRDQTLVDRLDRGLQGHAAAAFVERPGKGRVADERNSIGRTGILTRQRAQSNRK